MGAPCLQFHLANRIRYEEEIGKPGFEMGTANGIFWSPIARADSPLDSNIVCASYVPIASHMGPLGLRPVYIGMT